MQTLILYARGIGGSQIFLREQREEVLSGDSKSTRTLANYCQGRRRGAYTHLQRSRPCNGRFRGRSSFFLYLLQQRSLFVQQGYRPSSLIRLEELLEQSKGI